MPDGGVGDAEKVCAAVAKELGLPSASYVLPSSTGVIGWRLPYQAIIDGMVRQLESPQHLYICLMMEPMELRRLTESGLAILPE